MNKNDKTMNSNDTNGFQIKINGNYLSAFKSKENYQIKVYGYKKSLIVVDIFLFEDWENEVIN